ncbi:hypothetical protein T12_3735 [Trichinella patagoniensis]|uniref:Uncharacterized protein n=1 Tax=Trichinella patagoniensis TaxID=990121 RepID=A0A0V0ZXJ3_9BILA|nr:hypothetical protein T12_3735 [Trichinella patagoniensis]
MFMCKNWQSLLPLKERSGCMISLLIKIPTIPEFKLPGSLWSKSPKTITMKKSQNFQNKFFADFRENNQVYSP